MIAFLWLLGLSMIFWGTVRWFRFEIWTAVTWLQSSGRATGMRGHR